MGTDYYLIRPDNGTLYDLGKISTFRRSLGGGVNPSPLITIKGDDSTLDSLAIDLKTDWDAEYTEPAGIEYFQALARDICRWACGMPFRFASEHDAQFDAWVDESPTDPQAWARRITGDRHGLLERIRDSRIDATLTRHPVEVPREGFVATVLHVADGATGIRTSELFPVKIDTMTVSGKGSIGIDLDD